MIKDKEKTVEVTVNNGDKEEKVTLLIKKPNNAVLSQAQRVGAKAWTDCVRDGIMTKKELEKFMKEQGIWDDGKDEEQRKIIQEISDLEKSLYVGSAGHKKLKASEGKEIAIKMRVKRNELRDLIAEKMSLEQNTAEAISDNARFDFLVANCTFRENGSKLYNSLEEYRENADSDLGFAAASALASMLYSVDKDFEAKLPENKFLKMFNFVNEDLSLVNNKGETVDLEGRKIDKNGYYINEEGKRVDKDGNPLDEFGNYIPTVTYVTENEESSQSEDSKVGRPKKAKVSESN
jgi:hypothetical protein